MTWIERTQLHNGHRRWGFERWINALADQPNDEAAAIQRATLVGEPFCATPFVERLEIKAGRRLDGNEAVPQSSNPLQRKTQRRGWTALVEIGVRGDARFSAKACHGECG